MKLVRNPRFTLFSYNKSDVRSFKFVLNLILFCFLTSNVFSQSNKTVRGKITDETGKPIPQVSVTIKNTSKGTVTNSDGNFTLSAPEGSVLSVSYVGYQPSEITIKDRSDYAISLKSSNQALEQVVVIGYGTQRRALVTGAVASVSGKTIAEVPVSSVDQALQGRVAGVTVTNNGAPGTAPIVRIRGISSITQNSDPLYVVDGFPTSGLLNFDSRDVESVEVLKDAASAAIYGSRASNGVVIITTKKGRRDGKMQVTLDSYIGVQNAANKLDLLNTNQYVKYERMLNGAAGIGVPPRLQPENFNQPIYTGATQTYAQLNTDWQDQFFKSGLITQHDVGLSGGNSVSRFYTSAGYFKQEGIAPGVGYERFNIRLNSDQGSLYRIYRVRRVEAIIWSPETAHRGRVVDR